MTTSKSIQKREWTSCRKTIDVDQNRLAKPPIVTIASISSQQGIELSMNFEKSINRFKFVEYLKRLREVNKNEEIVIFLDRLSVHRCEYVTQAAQRLRFTLIYNASY